MTGNSTSLEIQRAADWKRLYAELLSTLSAHGRNDPFGDGDFFLIDDDYGSFQHKVECSTERFFRSEAVADAHRLLQTYDEQWRVIFVLSATAGGPAATTVGSIGMVHQQGRYLE